MGILLHDFKRLGPHLGAEPASIFSVGLCRFGSCLAGWPDHPRRAVDKSGRSPPEPRPPYAVPHAAPGRGWMRLRPARGRSRLSIGGRCTKAEGSPALREFSSSSPAPTRGTLIWNRRPSRSKSNLISARHWVVRSRWIKFDPNPFRLGGPTSGPSCSAHHNPSLREPSVPRTSHSTSSQPRGVEKAPYLAALVLSS